LKFSEIDRISVILAADSRGIRFEAVSKIESESECENVYSLWLRLGETNRVKGAVLTNSILQQVLENDYSKGKCFNDGKADWNDWK